MSLNAMASVPCRGQLPPLSEARAVRSFLLVLVLCLITVNPVRSFNISLSADEVVRLSGLNPNSSLLSLFPNFNIIDSGAANRFFDSLLTRWLGETSVDGVFPWRYGVGRNAVARAWVQYQLLTSSSVKVQPPANVSLSPGQTAAELTITCLARDSTMARVRMNIFYQVDGGPVAQTLPLVLMQDCSNYVQPTSPPPTTVPPPTRANQPTTAPRTISTVAATPQTGAGTGLSTTAMIGIIIGLLAFIGIVVVVAVRLELYGRRHWRGRKKGPPPEQSMFEDVVVEADDLTIGRQLGKGAFGVVHEGVHKGEKVAVKVMKEPENDDRVVKFLEEALHMKNFHHPNVLCLRGVCFQPDEAPMIVVPYMANGDLHTYLNNHNPHLNPDAELLEYHQLLNFSIQVTNAMVYLASVNFVHRDLAARNCLLSENLVVKVADFGLARDMQDDLYYRMNSELRLPVKWTAPESIKHHKFTIESDIWAYGVLLWEIMSHGVLPYPGIDNQDLIPYLESGQRLHKPTGCPDSVYKVMLACWHEEPRQRPGFLELKRMLRESDGHIYANVMALPIYLDLRAQERAMMESSASSSGTSNASEHQYSNGMVPVATTTTNSQTQSHGNSSAESVGLSLQHNGGGRQQYVNLAGTARAPSAASAASAASKEAEAAEEGEDVDGTYVPLSTVDAAAAAAETCSASASNGSAGTVGAQGVMARDRSRLCEATESRYTQSPVSLASNVPAAAAAAAAVAASASANTSDGSANVSSSV